MRPGDRLQWFTTTAWMMWNALVSTLLLRASIVMIDGNPAIPTSPSQWRLAEETRPTMLGLSPAFIDGLPQGRAGARAGLRPLVAPVARRRRLAAPARGLRVALRPARTGDVPQRRQRRHGRLHRASSRATRCFRSTPARSRGAASPSTLRPSTLDGKPVVGELGELVIRQPMPSMPVGFWNDPDGSRYRAAYFDYFPGVWRHGDWIMFTERGQLGDHRPLRRDAQPRRRSARDERALLGGRGDRGGARQPRRPPRGVRRAAAVRRPAARRRARRRAARAHRRRRSATALSPRHAPDAIVAVPAIPRTLTGKKLELPGQADPHRHRRRRRRQPRRARRPGRDRAVRRLRPLTARAVDLGRGPGS